jgi:hypothetical protein
MWSEQEQRRSSSSGTACPELARLLDGLERREKAFIEHARLCPHCAGEWALYKGFMLPDVYEADNTPAPSFQRPFWLALSRRIWTSVLSWAERVLQRFGNR